MEDSSDVAGWFESRRFFEQNNDSAGKIARLMKVRPAEIKKTANEIFAKHG